MIEAGDLDIREVWWIERNGERVGYLLARRAENILHVRDALLDDSVSIDDALFTLAKTCETTYVEATVYRARDIERLKRAGYYLATPDWSVFMMKTLSPEASLNEARARFGFETERFLISPLDVT